MIMLPGSYHQKWFPRIFFHINIYDEGAAFPFARISRNESLYTLQYFTSHGPARTQHPASLLWASTGSTGRPPANRTAIRNPSAAFQGPKFWPSQERWSWEWAERARGSEGNLVRCCCACPETRSALDSAWGRIFHCRSRKRAWLPAPSLYSNEICWFNWATVQKRLWFMLY